MLERYFQIGERESTAAREVRGGLVTFVTMAYVKSFRSIPARVIVTCGFDRSDTPSAGEDGYAVMLLGQDRGSAVRSLVREWRCVVLNCSYVFACIPLLDCVAHFC